MSRGTLILILILVVVIGGIVYLSSRDTEVPQTRIEKPVTLDNGTDAAAR